MLGCCILPSISFFPSYSSRKVFRTITGANEFDYEYIPPHADAAPKNHPSDQLSSAYPPNTPAGLRGEAIRSAFRSGRGVGWKLDDRGVVRVQGPGTIDFLNGKLTQTVPRSENSFFCEACILSPKGYMIDCIHVAVVNPQLAYLITSPGHAGSVLFGRLNKYVFPLDEVTLTDMDESTDMFSLASIRVSDVQTCVANWIAPELGVSPAPTLPHPNRCLPVDLTSQTPGASLLIIPSSGLHACAGPGYTFLFLHGDELCTNLWTYLTSDACESGPIAAGAREYEPLRIESGQPGYGAEMDSDTTVSPVALHLAVDSDKGCYMGQEGVASTLKNPRGPPRSLYHVVFADENNIYDYQSEGEFVGNKQDNVEDNLTRTPAAGDQLFVLGSYEEISVGTITSVAEPSSTGEQTTIALALVRRADSIRRKMAARNIDMPKRSLGEHGEVLPPPLDTLDGVEVIIGGTFTVGCLKMLPGRSQKRLFVDDVPDFVDDLPSANDDVFARTASDASKPVEERDESEDIERQFARAEAEAEAAAAEARRKEEKMEMLRKRAEAAMARRKKKNSNGS